MNHTKGSLTKSRRTLGLKLKQEIFKKEMNHEQINEDTWEHLLEAWVPLLKNDLFSLVFIYAIYRLKKAKTTAFGQKQLNLEGKIIYLSVP